jgi:hypothetical protein
MANSDQQAIHMRRLRHTEDLDSRHGVNQSDELDELMNLAEKSTLSIDSIQQLMDKAFLQSIVGLLLSYLLVAGCLAFSISLDKQYNFSDVKLLREALVVLTIIGIFTGIMFFTTSWQKAKHRVKLRRSLAIELDIHARLISLIHDQFERIKTDGSLSPVSLATIEIRILRLQRRIYRTNSFFDVFFGK